MAPDSKPSMPERPTGTEKGKDETGQHSDPCPTGAMTGFDPAVASEAARQIGFAKGGGLVPAIAQDATTGQVLMLAWMNPDALRETLATGRAVYFSRSRNRLWRKGDESGHVQQVVEVRFDCDADAILLRVHQTGPACHEGYRSCFFRQFTQEGVRVILSRADEDSEAGP